LRALFFVCVVDVLGFGILIPLVPYMATRFGASPALITPILGVYSLFQLVGAPIWGSLSDRFGRRPILITSMLGAAVSYLMLYRASSVTDLFLARAVAGFMAGNIAAAMAYASDISAPADRARSLGMVGAAIGIGFMLGPAIGGALAGEHIERADFGPPALLSTGLSLLAAMLVAWQLPESHRMRLDASRETPRTRWGLLRARPVLRWLTGAALLVTFSQSTLDSTFAISAMQRYDLGPRTVGLAMLALAIVVVLMQTIGVRQLVPLIGEFRLACLGIACWVAGMLAVAVSGSLLLVLPGLVLCGLGSGAFAPGGAALATQQADGSSRGIVIGTYQFGSSLARVLAPFVSGAMLERLGGGAPYLFGAVVTLQAGWCMLAVRRRQRRDGSGA
jgi:MFS family permease